jgi:large subunit ribosomal protein L30
LGNLKSVSHVAIIKFPNYAIAGFGTMAKKAEQTGGKLQLKWVRSAICAPMKQKKVVRGLGFTRLNQIIERPDTPAIRGMVAKVPHLVEIVQ